MRAIVRGAPALVSVMTLLVIGYEAPALGQGTQPLPPLPPAGAEPAPPPPAPQPPPPPASPPPVVYAPSPPAQYAYAPPPPGSQALSEAEVTHAPKYSLWLGGRLGILGYGGGLYINDVYSGAIETTGNFVRPGLGLEADIGARIARRYIPYLALELGLTGAGHRFDPATTSAGTSFVGLGFRFLAGDVDEVSFVSDLSFGIRKFQVSNGGGTWDASGLDFRLGLGVDIRMTSHFTLSPLFTLSGGTLTDTSGTVSFAPGQPDGQTQPPYSGGQFPAYAQSSYIAVVLGCGAHFDLFGK